MSAIKRLFIIVLSVLTICGCQKNPSIEDILGTWEIVNTESSGKKVLASKYLGIEQINLLADGSYHSIASENEATGQWKIRGNKLLLESPEIKALNGKEIAPKRSSEWYVFATEGWMYWEGTGKFNHQHLKITLKALSINNLTSQVTGKWFLKDRSAELDIKNDKTFEYTSLSSSFKGTWLSDSSSLTLISDENLSSGSERVMRLKYSNQRLYPKSSGSDYYFEKE